MNNQNDTPISYEKYSITDDNGVIIECYKATVGSTTLHRLSLEQLKEDVKNHKEYDYSKAIQAFYNN